MPVYYKDDHGFNLDFKITHKADGSDFNLAGYTIEFFMWLPSAAVSKVIAGIVNIDVAASGTCHHPILAADFDTVGSYNWELVLTQLGVEVHVRGNKNFIIKEEHP